MHAPLLNVDGTKGLVTAIIYIAPRVRIPSHDHNDGAEAHDVLSGDLLENGVPAGCIPHRFGRGRARFTPIAAAARFSRCRTRM